jgi:hypothetical protein
MHPGKALPLPLNVTREETEIFAVIVTDVRNVTVVTEPARAKELKDDVSKTSVTVIVIDCVPALPELSVAVRVNS